NALSRGFLFALGSVKSSGSLQCGLSRCLTREHARFLTVVFADDEVPVVAFGRLACHCSSTRTQHGCINVRPSGGFHGGEQRGSITRKRTGFPTRGVTFSSSPFGSSLLAATYSRSRWNPARSYLILPM